MRNGKKVNINYIIYTRVLRDRLTMSRKSNFELLRILSIVGIITMHYMSSDLGGVIKNAAFPNFSWFYNHLILALAIPLVNCFILITGYFSLRVIKIRVDKILVLACTTAFYGLIAYSLACSVGICEFSINSFLLELLPYFEGKRWFVETYIILLLLMPFLNIVLNGLRQREYRILLLIQLGLFVCWYSVGASAPILDDGYGIINFITLYMIGGYINKFDSSKYVLYLKKYGLLIYIVCSLATFLLSYFINPYGYAFITNIIGATALFCFFSKLDFGNNQKINTLASAAFDVYLLHSDQYTSYLLISEWFRGQVVADTPLMILHMPIVVVALYSFGILTWFVRKKIFKWTLDRIPLFKKTIVIEQKGCDNTIQ